MAALSVQTHYCMSGCVYLTQLIQSFGPASKVKVPLSCANFVQEYRTYMN